MLTLRSKYSQVFDNVNAYQTRLYVNKVQLMLSSRYHETLLTTIFSCIVLYKNETFVSIALRTLLMPPTISFAVIIFLHNVVATFSPYIIPFNLDNDQHFLYFIMDYTTINNLNPLMYCGITITQAENLGVPCGTIIMKEM